MIVPDHALLQARIRFESSVLLFREGAVSISRTTIYWPMLTGHGKYRASPGLSGDPLALQGNTIIHPSLSWVVIGLVASPVARTA